MLIKAIVSMLTIGFMSASTLASSWAPPGYDDKLCNMTNESRFQENFTVLNQKTILEVDHATDKLFVVLNFHLLKLQYIQDPMSLESMKSLFGENGPYLGDNIVVTYFRDKETGKIHIATKSWPSKYAPQGDGSYTYIYNAHNNSPEAYIENGVVILTHGTNTIRCH